MGMTRSRLFVALAVLCLFTLAQFGCGNSTTADDADDGSFTETEDNADSGSFTETDATGPARPAVPWPGGFPQDFPSAKVSGNIPLDVELPKKFTTPLEIRPYFDRFSWESFIALNWPADGTKRGAAKEPDNSEVFYDAGPMTPVVWGTYKDAFDLFGQKDQRPNAWDAADGPVNPCPNRQAGQKTLIFTTKGDTALMETKQAFSFPLIDQRGNLVHYEIRYDEAQYNFIRGQDDDPASWLYRLTNLKPRENARYGVQMPMSTPPDTLGSIMVKAAWRIETDADDSSRFYTISAQIYSSDTKQCTPATVLLVGFHIAHKVAPFTEWVWSTFEQVDNVPADSGTSKDSTTKKSYSFNNGGKPATPNGYDYRPDASPTPPLKPVQVSRVNPIPDTPPGQSTRDVNAHYQELLKGTVWEYYELVVTQWPFNPGIGDDAPFKLMQDGGVYPQNAGTAFPVNGAVNTAMETYYQTQNNAAGAGGNSCMSCHYVAGQSDFSWSLNRRAY